MIRFTLRLGAIGVFIFLSSCGVDAPEPQSKPTAAPEKPVQTSLDGATCAVVAPDEDSTPWKRNYELTRCLRELAYQDWSQAGAEARHIADWSVDHAPLSEIVDILTRYETGDALGADLEARGLLGGPGARYFEDDTDENWQAITVSDWLRKSGYWYEFDAETGTFPNNHDYLLESLAAMFGEPLNGAVFVEIAPSDWESEDPYELRATLGERSWERVAANHGDWYDVQTVLDMLNTMAADVGASKRAMPLQTFDQFVTVVVGPGDALLAAANDGLLHPAVARRSMDRGKAFEDEVRKQLGL